MCVCATAKRRRRQMRLDNRYKVRDQVASRRKEDLKKLKAQRISMGARRT